MKFVIAGSLAFMVGCGQDSNHESAAYIAAGTTELLTVDGATWTRFACPSGWYSFIYKTENPQIAISYSIYSDEDLAIGASENRIAHVLINQLQRWADDSAKIEKIGVVKGAFGELPVYRMRALDACWNNHIMAIYQAEDGRIVDIGFPANAGVSLPEIKLYLDKMYSAKLIPKTHIKSAEGETQL